MSVPKEVDINITTMIIPWPKKDDLPPSDAKSFLIIGPRLKLQFFGVFPD
ncbi:MAG: hypothetical protein WD898_00370 [Candidatus Paceibacterota bacterium]